MAQPPTSEPGPSKADASATGVLRGQPDDPNFETDLAQLAAVFSAHGGGGLTPELSTDLALEIVLNEIVVQACLSTGATGAAIALERDGEMVCRASNGNTAPALGSRLDAASGLSGECIRTLRIQRSDDVLADARVDREASQRLGVRSVMVMPLVRGADLIGLFELFSAQPQAFGERDERTLEALTARIFSTLERAALPLPTQTPPAVPVQNEPIATAVPEAFTRSESEHLAPEDAAQTIAAETATAGFLTVDATAAHTPTAGLHAEDWALSDPGTGDPAEQGLDVFTWTLRAAVLVCAILLGLLLGRHLPNKKTVARSVAPPAAVKAPETTNPPAESNVPPEKQQAAEAVAQPAAPVKSKEKDLPAGGLRILENGKEIFSLPPAQNAATQNPAGSVERASSAEPDTSLSPLAPVAEGTLLYRVEPEYPEEARRKGIEGAVVLAVHIGGDGAVQSVQLVSGAPELAPPSIDAVKQWRFQPRRVNGRPTPMQTRVTLNFKLPQ